MQGNIQLWSMTISDKSWRTKQASKSKRQAKKNSNSSPSKYK